MIGYAAMTAILAAVDQGAKYWIDQQEAEGFPRPVKHTKDRVWLYHNQNRGFPFGFLKEQEKLVRTLPLVLISGLGGIFCYLLPKKGHRAEKLGLSLLLGGAVSNLIDRYWRGYVVEYVNLRFGWMKKVVLNLGDILVALGSLLLLTAQIAGDAKEALAAKKEQKAAISVNKMENIC